MNKEINKLVRVLTDQELQEIPLRLLSQACWCYVSEPLDVSVLNFSDTS